jgi:hypothetical protein
MPPSAATQRLVGEALVGIGIGLVISAATTWLRKYKRNANKQLQLLALLFSLIFNCLMVVVAHDFTVGKIGTRTTMCAFFATSLSAWGMYIYSYFMMTRLQSILQGEKRIIRNLLRLGTATIVLAYFLGDIMNYIAVGKSSLHVLTYVQSKEFNKIGKPLQTAGLFLYTAMVTVTDSLLLWKINSLRKNLGEERASLRNVVQILIITIGMMGKITEAALKIASTVESYMSIDSYFRGTNMGIEIWAIVELGVTIEEVLGAKRSTDTDSSKKATTSPGMKSPMGATRKTASADEP